MTTEEIECFNKLKADLAAANAELAALKSMQCGPPNCALCANLSEQIAVLNEAFAREVQWSHANCTNGNCRSSGENCPMNPQPPKEGE